MTRALTPLSDRLWPRVDAAGDCWLWTGATTEGYGVLGRGTRGEGTVYAHRAAWELLVGPIAKGSVLMPQCRVRTCCNPDHMQLAPRAVLLKMNEKRAKR